MKKINKFGAGLLILLLLVTSVVAGTEIASMQKDVKVVDYIEKNKGGLTTTEYENKLVEEVVKNKIEESNKNELFRLSRNIVNYNSGNVESAIQCLRRYEYKVQE